MLYNTSQNERGLLLKILNTAREYTTDILKLEQEIKEKEKDIESYQKYGEERHTKAFYQNPPVTFFISVNEQIEHLSLKIMKIQTNFMSITG